MRYQIHQTVDLAHPRPLVRWAEALLVEGDDSAHEWIVSVTDNGNPVDMTGYLVGASLVRSDGMTRLVNGTVSGNQVSIIFPSAVYRLGALVGRMKVQAADTVLSLAHTHFMVQKVDTETYLNDEGNIPDISQIIALFSEMELARDKTLASAEKADDAAERAKSAAESAETISQRLNNLSVEVEMLPPSEKPKATVTQDEGVEIKLGIPKVNVNIVTFEVDDEGMLWMNIPEDFEGLAFILTDNGVLEVEIND